MITISNLRCRLSDDIRDFMDLILDAEKQAQEDTGDDKKALHMIDEMHLQALLKDTFFGMYG